jgi:glucose PTS system EIICB or EIICBA component
LLYYFSISDKAIAPIAQAAMTPLDTNAAHNIQAIITALGGKPNIRQVKSVALTRLRIEVADSTVVKELALKDAGVEGVLLLPSGKLHLLVGLNAEQYAMEMKGQLAAIR